MNNVMTLLTNNEIKQVVGGEKNGTNYEINKNAGFQLMEHPWLLTGIVVGGVSVLIIYVYFCYKCCKMASADGGYYNDDYFSKYGKYRV